MLTNQIKIQIKESFAVPKSSCNFTIVNTTLVEENYIKALFTLANHEGAVNVNDLSIHLDIKKPTVTSMMKKLASKNLIHYESYKPVRLTQSGKKTAALIIRKHRLTEMFLVEKMGFGWEEVHMIAEQVEHIKSPLFFNKMDEILGFPKVDPHGSPIPDKEGNIERKEYKTLSQCKTGELIQITSVTKASDDFLKFLNSKSIALGLEMRILSKESFDQSMTVSYKGYPSTTLSAKVCERLLVKNI